MILPLFVLAVLAAARNLAPRRRLTVLAGALAIATAYSAYRNGTLAEGSIDRAYFGTDTRAAEMLIGALLACATIGTLRLHRRGQRALLAAAGVAAAGVTAWLWHSSAVDDRWLYPWGLLASAVCTAAIITIAVQGGRAARLLSLRPLVALGRISYGVYLLHWPVFLWLTPARTGLAPWPLFALRMAITIAAATAMLKLLEDPVRHGRALAGRAAPIITAAAVAALIAGTLFVTRDLEGPSSLQIASEAQGDDNVTTTIPEAPVRVLVVGDQVAASLGEHWGAVDGLEVNAATVDDCGLALGGFITTASGAVEFGSKVR